jgi:hydroxymethylglutaryl-CoA lyase
MNPVLVSEVGLRDGLQSISRVMPFDAKKRWIAAEAAAGVREIEVGSFVPASLLPQMADTADLVAFARTISGLTVVALVPNAKGGERAIAARVHALSLPFSMSETHSLRNVGKDHRAVLNDIRAIRALIDSEPVDQRPGFAVGLSTAFGCSIEGRVDPEIVERMGVAAIEAGADEVGLSDTTGSADPASVKALVRRLANAVGPERAKTLHLHNTRGLGLANALAGLEEGITTLDASLGGLGGCPAAPGASGNIVTEDLVYMLQAMGVPTGIDLARLLTIREILRDALPGEPLYGFIPDAGVPAGFMLETSA